MRPNETVHLKPPPRLSITDSIRNVLSIYILYKNYKPCQLCTMFVSLYSNMLIL